MLKSDDQFVLATLSFLAQMNSQLDTFRTRLKQQMQLHVAAYVECRTYNDTVYICICLEVAPQEARTLTWWMDITPREGMWLIEGAVLLNGRTTVAQTGSQRVFDFQTVRAEVPEILEHLLQAGATILDKVRTENEMPDTYARTIH